MTRTARRALVIGLDGATWDLFEPLVARGRLPILRSLLETSRRGVLRAPFPPVTAPSWTTFATGVDPGRHGVFDFFELVPGRYRKRVIDLSRWPVQPIWRRVEAAGGSAVVVNFPTLARAEQCRGASVAGMLAPAEADSIFEPRVLYDELRRELGEYRVDTPWPGGGPRSIPAYCAAVGRCTRERGRWARRILERRPWNLALVVFVTPDRLQHKVWEALWRARLNDPVNDPQGAAALAALDAMDQAIGELITTTRADDDVVLVSDHGFGPARGVFEPNVLLAEAGVLAPRALRVAAARAGKAARSAWRRSSVSQRGRAAAGVGETTTGRAFESLIDWRRTRAFALSTTDMGIYVNSTDRFPQGCVRGEAEREKVVREVVDALQGARDPRTGSRLSIRARRREEIFAGELLRNAPDVCFTVAEGAIHSGTRVDAPLLHDAEFLRGDGNHRREGIYAYRGAGVAPGYDRRGAEMRDMAPTILQRIGVDRGEGLDGVPLFE